MEGLISLKKEQNIFDYLKLRNPDVFSNELIEYLKSEGFEKYYGCPYCSTNTNDDFDENCAHVYELTDDYILVMYIFSFAIGYDINYDSGGNSSNNLFYFYDSLDDFKKCYNLIVKEVFLKGN